MLVTPSTIASVRRAFCSSVLPGHSFTMTWGMGSFRPRTGEIFLVGHLLHPGDVRSVYCFLDRDMRHGGGGRRAVPVLVAGRAPDHVAGADFVTRLPLALRPAGAQRDDEGLAKRMAVPRGPGSRLKGHDRSSDARWIRSLEHRIDANVTGEPVSRPLGGRLRAVAVDLHWSLLIATAI